MYTMHNRSSTDLVRLYLSYHLIFFHIVPYTWEGRDHYHQDTRQCPANIGRLPDRKPLLKVVKWLTRYSIYHLTTYYLASVCYIHTPGPVYESRTLYTYLSPT